jgi:hypothetical protein
MIFLSYNVYKYMYFAQEDISGNWPMSITERDVITRQECGFLCFFPLIKLTDTAYS